MKSLCFSLLIAGLLPGSTTDSEDVLSYFLAVKTESEFAEAMPVEGIPSGPEWVADTYVTAVGVEIPIVRKRTPDLVLQLTAIREALVYQTAPDVGLFPSSTHVYVDLVVDELSRASFQAIANKYSSYWLLVVHEGRHIDFRTQALSGRPGGGVFDSEEHAKEFYAWLGDELHVEHPSAEEVKEWREFYAAGERQVLWDLKCSTEERDSMRQLGHNVDEIMELAAEQIAEIDCSGVRPEMPVLPGAREQPAEPHVELPDLLANPTFVISVEIEGGSEEHRFPPMSTVRLRVDSGSGKVCLMEAAGCKESARLLPVKESWPTTEAPFELVLGQDGPEAARDSDGRTYSVKSVKSADPVFSNALFTGLDWILGQDSPYRSVFVEIVRGGAQESVPLEIRVKEPGDNGREISYQFGYSSP